MVEGVVVKKWLAKNNTASAMGKLLRNKREDDIDLQTSKLPKTPVSCRGSCVSNVMKYSASKRYPVIASAWIPVRMSGRTEETRREIEALHKHVKMEACGYQIEAQKGVAKSSKNEKASDQKHEMNPSEITIKSNKGSAKNLKTNGRADICYQGISIALFSLKTFRGVIGKKFLRNMCETEGPGRWYECVRRRVAITMLGFTTV